MAQDRDAFLHDGLHFPSLADSAFQFDCFRAGVPQGPGGFHRLGFTVVGADREVGHQKSLPATAGGGSHMVQHVVEGDMGGVGKAEHHHSQRVSHQDEIRARLIQQARSGIVPGGEGSNGRSHLLPGAEGGTLVTDRHGKFIAPPRGDASPGE